MSRLIRFRLWDKNKKIVLPECCGNFEGSFETENEYHVVQQSTGLYDKNDVEIFEGDIIEHGFEKHICEIKWQDYKFVFIDRDMSRRFDLDCMMKDVKVIGNIFE